MSRIYHSDLHRELSILYINADRRPLLYETQEEFDIFKRSVLDVLTRCGADIPEIQAILLSPSSLQTWAHSYAEDQVLKVGFDDSKSRHIVTIFPS